MNLSVLLAGAASLLFTLGLPTASAGDKDKHREFAFRCSASDPDHAYGYVFDPINYYWTDKDGDRKDDGTFGVHGVWKLCDPVNQLVYGSLTVSGKADGMREQRLDFNVYRYKRADYGDLSALEMLKEIKGGISTIWSTRSAKFGTDNKQTNTVRAPDFDT